MELNHDIITTPPLDSASVVLLRDSAQGLQVLLLDGSPLPEWLTFDGKSGTFEGE